MKKSMFGKIGAAAVVLTLVTTSLVGGTFAKYTSTASGTAKATIAKWDVAFTGNSTAFTKDTEIVLTGSGADNTVAPGDTGELVLAVNAADAQVDVDYEITLPSASVGGHSYLEFFSDADRTKAITADDLKGTIEKTATGNDRTVSKPVYWKLASSDTVGADGNGADNAMSGSAEVYNISITATQKVASTPAP